MVYFHTAFCSIWANRSSHTHKIKLLTHTHTHTHSKFFNISTQINFHNTHTSGICSKIHTHRSHTLNQKFIAHSIFGVHNMVPPVFWNIQNITFLQHTFPATLTHTHTHTHENGTITLSWHKIKHTAYRKGGALEMDENIESALDTNKTHTSLSDEENFLARHNEHTQNLLGRHRSVLVVTLQSSDMFSWTHTHSQLIDEKSFVISHHTPAYKGCTSR